MNNVNVVYTPWSNLKKTADMDVGQIGFHRQKDVSVLHRWRRRSPGAEWSIRLFCLTPLLLRAQHDVCFLKGIKLGC